MQNRQHAQDLQLCQLPLPALVAWHNPPAPITTLDSPLQSDQKPSARDIVTMAFEIPLYMALGDGLTICIRVYRESARCRQCMRSLVGSCAP
jgi:hypothetical protein